MSNLPVHGGLDYHQGSIQACVVDEKHGKPLLNRRFANDVTAIADAMRSHGDVQSVAIESCCGAAEFSEALHTATGWSITLAHPGYVNRMKLNPDKTDFGDARLLADLSRVGYIPKVWLAPREIRELRTLVRRRQSCVDQKKKTKLQISSLLRTRRITSPSWAGSRWTRPWMTWIRSVETSDNDRWVFDELLDDLQSLQGKIKRAEERLTAETCDDPFVGFLQTLPTIGPVTAWVMRAEIARADRFRTGKQLARFCGVSPRNCSSGERVADSGLIRAGNPQLKTVIIQAAHRLRQHDRRWSAFAGQLELAGKPTNVVVGAVANRWIRWLFHQMKAFEKSMQGETCTA